MWPPFWLSLSSVIQLSGHIFSYRSVTRTPARARTLQSQIVKRRNGLCLWSNMRKWPSGLMCILIHHHGNGHIIYRCVAVGLSSWMHACFVSVFMYLQVNCPMCLHLCRRQKVHQRVEVPIYPPVYCHPSHLHTDVNVKRFVMENPGRL